LHRQPAVELRIPLEEAEALHALLERLLEGGEQDPRLEHSYRLLGWRILAADSLEEYEAARERELGPVLDGLERGENRDP
jgi:hypothetical protein